MLGRTELYCSRKKDQSLSLTSLISEWEKTEKGMGGIRKKVVDKENYCAKGEERQDEWDMQRRTV